MHCKLNIGVSYLLLLFLSGCGVSKMEFDAVTNEYRLSQRQMTANEEKIKELEKQLQEMKTLRKTIREQQIIISLQGKVIKLLDDSDQTLQKSIEAQIATQNIKMDTFPPSP